MRASLLGTTVIAGAAGLSAQAPSGKPSSPEVVAPPMWSRVLQMPDGRTFVTDGGLSIDAAFAKPAALPTNVLAPESAKILAGYFTVPHDQEFGLGELVPGRFPNSLATPGGLQLNGNYITFLRQAVPARARLRTRGPTDPVVVVVDGEPVAILMPLAPKRN
jgi:hypothetical protein